jgi:hypothetical protein
LKSEKSTIKIFEYANYEFSIANDPGPTPNIGATTLHLENYLIRVKFILLRFSAMLIANLISVFTLDQPLNQGWSPLN